MILPATLAPITLEFPWPTTILGVPYTTLPLQYDRDARRTYAPDMQVARYVSPLGGATTAAVIACHVDTYDNESAGVWTALVGRAVAAAAYRLLRSYVYASAPGGAPLPSGCRWPVTAAVGAYLAAPSGTPPVPLGAYAALRILPNSDYPTTTVAVACYRGSGPPPA